MTGHDDDRPVTGADEAALSDGDAGSSGAGLGSSGAEADRSDAGLGSPRSGLNQSGADAGNPREEAPSPREGAGTHPDAPVGAPADRERRGGCPFGHDAAGQNTGGHPGGPRFSRRAMLIGSSAIAALGAGLVGAGGFTAGRHYGIAKGTEDADVMRTRYPMRGVHQPGVLTPQQQQMHTAAYDVVTDSRDDLIDLLKNWSLAAERLMSGNLVEDYTTSVNMPPGDTGETGDLGPAALTITFGFGATLFRDAEGKDRFGIADRLPASLADGIPRMAAEKIDPDISGGDLIIQACAEDPMVAMHAIHNLTRIAFGTAVLRWSQLGYGRTSSTSTGQATPRNLFGFKDGTSNIKAEDSDSELNEHLWIQPGDEPGSWAAGGTYLCIRKIKQFMEVWDELILSEQQNVIGRTKITGAPLSGGEEFTDPDFSKRGSDGEPVIPVDSHVALVHPSHNSGRRMLRRGYNYMEGNDRLGRLEGGLFFIAFVRDPATNFIPVLRNMYKDQLTEYLQHLSSSVFLIPPGLGQNDEYIGQALFEK